LFDPQPFPNTILQPSNVVEALLGLRFNPSEVGFEYAKTVVDIDTEKGIVTLNALNNEQEETNEQ
jgi:hypothetical protein